jgi:hypothetical protein
MATLCLGFLAAFLTKGWWALCLIWFWLAEIFCILGNKILVIHIVVITDQTSRVLTVRSSVTLFTYVWTHKRGKALAAVLLSYRWRKEVDCIWNVMVHDAREEKWRGNKRMEWVTSKCHMTAEHRFARAIQTLQADVHSSPASSRVNWRPCRFKWTRPFRLKTKSGFCACAITFQTQSTTAESFKEVHNPLSEKVIYVTAYCLIL